MYHVSVKVSLRLKWMSIVFEYDCWALACIEQGWIHGNIKKGDPDYQQCL